MKKRLLLALSILALIALGLASISWIRRPITTAVMRGQQVAERHGCFTCHGPGGMKSFPNAGSPEGEIPRWDGGTWMMYIEEESEIREWIVSGRPRRLEGTHGDPDTIEHQARDAGGAVTMPAYGNTIDPGDLDDLIAYYKAVAWYDPAMPQPAAEGRRVASRLGCFACHGPSGRGGPPNPGSFKGYIPPWDGEDFAELVRDDEELRTWILDGEIPRLSGNPLAQEFLQNQKIQMPAYRDRLRADELTSILAYIHYMRTPTSP